MSTSPLPTSSPLTRYQKMFEVAVFNNHLEARLCSQLVALKEALLKVVQALEQQHTAGEIGPRQGDLALVELKESAQKTLQEVLPEIVELCVVAADRMYNLESLIIDTKRKCCDLQLQLLHQRDLVESIESSPTFRAARAVSQSLRQVAHALTGSKPSTKKSPTDSAVVSSNRVTAIDSIGNNATEERVAGCAPRVDLAQEEFQAYVSVDNSGTAFALFRDWFSVFHHDGVRYGSKTPAVTDNSVRLNRFHEIIPFTDKTILELGSFEGANSKQLLDLGAKRVLGLEANREAFLKSLLVKNEFQLDGFRVVYGDVNHLLSSSRFTVKSELEQIGQFDAVFASGILYHLEDPLGLLDKICPLTSTIYVWSQVATEAYPQGEWVNLTDQRGRLYRARRHNYTSDQQWGGVSTGAYWLTKDDMLRAFAERGFQVMGLEVDSSPTGHAVSFVAVRL